MGPLCFIQKSCISFFCLKFMVFEFQEHKSSLKHIVLVLFKKCLFFDFNRFFISSIKFTYEHSLRIIPRIYTFYIGTIGYFVGVSFGSSCSARLGCYVTMYFYCLTIVKNVHTNIFFDICWPNGPIIETPICSTNT